MMNDERREVEMREGMLSEGSARWRGNEAGMRVISFQDVRNKAEGQRVSDVFVSVCVCVCVFLPPETGRGGLVRRSRSISSLSQPVERFISVKGQYCYSTLLKPTVC